jgi:hypothetical protein
LGGENMIDWTKIMREAKKSAEESASRSNTSGVPVMFVNEGITKFRLYYDPKSELILRSLFRHKINNVKLPCVGEGCQICLAAMRHEENGYQNIWRWKPKEVILAYGYVVQTNYTSDYVILNKPCCLAFDWRAKNEINKRITEWDEKILDQLFTPTVSAPLFSLDLKKGRGGNCSFGVDMMQCTIPSLPEEFPSLYDILQKPDAVPSEEDVKKALVFMQQTVMVSSKVSNPAEAAVDKSMSQQDKFQNIPQEVTQTLPFDSAFSQPQQGEQPSQQDTLGATAKEGAVPSCLGKHEVSPQCLLCSQEKICIDKTQGAK